MNQFIIKVSLTGKKVKDSIEYSLDLTLAKPGQLGDKLLCAPAKFNIGEGMDPIAAIVGPAAHLQGGRNSYLKVILSYPTGVIMSSRQIYDDIDRVLYYVSRLAYVTVPQAVDANGKRLRKAKGERQEQVDLRRQPAVYGIHVDTDNVHLHGGPSIVHPDYLQNIRINDGKYIFAFAYARQMVLHERGQLAKDDLLYTIGKEDGRNVVKIDCRVQARRKARELALAKDRARTGSGSGAAGMEVDRADGLDEGMELDAGNGGIETEESLCELASVHFRNRLHIAKVFKEICAAFPDGPKPGVRKGVSKLKQQQLDCAKLSQVLVKNNAGITTGEQGGLVFICNKEHARMRDIDQHQIGGARRWTKAAVEALTGLTGRWTVGLSRDSQTFLFGRWAQRDSLGQYAPDYVSLCSNATDALDQLPWPEYRVKITHIGRYSQRRMTRAEVRKYVVEYRDAAVRDHLVLGKPKTKEERQLANITLIPALDDGCATITVRGVKAVHLDTAKALDPNLVIRTDLDGVEQYSCTYTMRYPVAQREAGRNAISMVGKDLVRVLGGSGWTSSFKLPGLPVVGLIGRTSVVPTIVGQPHDHVSQALQALLPAAWERVVADERADTLLRSRVLAQQAGLNPAEVVARLAATSPLRPPLQQVVEVNAETLALAHRLVPLPAKRQPTETAGPKRVKAELPAPSTQLAHDEEERRRRKREAEQAQAEKAARSESDGQIHGL